MVSTRFDQLTQEELVKALIAGVSLSLPDGSSWAPLDEPLRRVLNGVWPNRIRSSDSRASADEAEDILNAAKTTSPLPAWTPSASSATTSVWHLLRVSTRHFGGVNGPAGDEPVDIDLDDKGLLIYGRNGSGKTSLSRAIIWGLTGRIIDSDGIDRPAIEITSNYSANGRTQNITLPTIIPFPTRAQINSPAGIRLPEVTLRFRAAHDRVLLVQRKLVRTRQSFSQVCQHATVSDDGQTSDWSDTGDVSSALGIPQQAVENAALQVGRLEKLNPSANRNPLAQGLERLSGLTRLGEVVDRLANRLSRYISGDFLSSLQADAGQRRTNVMQALQRVRTALDDGGVEGLPAGDTSAPNACEQHLNEVEAFLTPMREVADKALSDVLGLAEGEAPPANAQEELVRARDVMRDLTSKDPLETVLSVWATPEKTAELRAKANEVKARMERYDALQQDRARKIRSALYARIEKWAEDEGQPAVDWANCPVCETDLADVNDPMLFEPIRQVAEQARRDAQLLRDDANRLDTAWANELTGLWAGCPGVDALELLARAPALLGIEPLRQRSDLLGLVLKKVVPEPPESPAQPIQSTTIDHVGTSEAIATATILADRLDELWHSASEICQERSRLIAEINDLLNSVDQALRSHRPIRTALAELTSARTALSQWKQIHEKIALARCLGRKLADFARVRTAIDAVVAHTLGTMKQRAIGEYYQRLYRAPWSGQPVVRDVEAAQDAKLEILAAIDDVTGDGARLLNQSHLRAVLLAFAGAIKETADTRSGGINVIILDDPQTLVDDINRDGLGGWLKALRSAGSRPIAFTHSETFASVVEAKLEIPRIRVRPSSGMRDRGKLLLVGGANEIKDLSDRLSTTTEEKIYRDLCAAIRIELEDRLRDYCDIFGIEVRAAGPTLHDYRMALTNARSQPAYRERLTIGPFNDLLRDRYITRGNDIAGRVLDALNEAHHAPKDSVTESDAWQAKAAWEHLLPMLSACDRIAFDALNAPRVLPSRSPEPRLFRVPPVPVTAAVAAFQRTSPEESDGWQPLDLQECHAVRVRRGFDWLPTYVKGGDVLLLSPGEPDQTADRLLFVRHFRPVPNTSVDTTLGFSGKSHGRLAIWGVGGKGAIVEQHYEVETVRAVLFAAFENTGGQAYGPVPPDDVDIAEFKAAPIMGESAEPFARAGDHILIREQDRIETGQPLVDQQLYLLETADGTAAIKRYSKEFVGGDDVLVFQPAALTLGGAGTTILARWGSDAEDSTQPNTISGLWPIRGILFAAR